MSGPRLVAAILGGLVAIALLVGIGITVHRAGPDSAQPSRPLVDGQPSDRWSEGQRSAFIDACVKSCRASPGVTPDRYPLCDQACKCGADEGEKIVTGQELVEIYKTMQSGRPTKEQNDKFERMKAAGIACAAKGSRP